MPSRTTAAALAAVASLGLATACEKKSPIVTVTAHGVVVKAHAVEYCRGTECDTSDEIPVLTIHPGDTIGIDVPRSVAEQGWRWDENQPYVYDHYRHISVGDGQLESGREFPLQIQRDPKHGRGEWRFILKVK
jgi:hypothetical protein